MSNAARKARKRAGEKLERKTKVPTQTRRVKENPMLTAQMIRAAYLGAEVFWQRTRAAVPTFPSAIQTTETPKESA